MANGLLTKSLIMTSPVIAAAVISLIFSINLAMNPAPEVTYTPPTTTTRPPATTTRPPTTTVPPTTPPTTPPPTITASPNF